MNYLPLISDLDSDSATVSRNNIQPVGWHNSTFFSNWKFIGGNNETTSTSKGSFICHDRDFTCFTLFQGTYDKKNINKIQFDQANEHLHFHSKIDRSSFAQPDLSLLTLNSFCIYIWNAFNCIWTYSKTI